jgi:hypothetical protein
VISHHEVRVCDHHIPREPRGDESNAARLFWDARGVEVTRAYNTIVASRRLLTGVIFQGPYQGCARCRRIGEHTTLAPHKNLVGM